MSLIYKSYLIQIDISIIVDYFHFYQYTVTINSSNPMLLDSSPIRTGSSPGNKNPAVLAYDPTGLRSSMSATWEELDKAVLLNALPNHLPGIMMFLFITFYYLFLFHHYDTH